MPLTPSTAAQNTATLAGSNLASLSTPLTALQTAISGGLLAPAAYIDAILSSVGYQAHDASLVLGATSTTSTSFVDIGNGSSTGFSTFTFSAAIAKTYLVHVDLTAYQSVISGADIMTFQVVNTTTSTNYTDASMSEETDANNTMHRVSFRVPVAMNVGNNILKLQWKTTSGCTANVNTASWRSYTVTG